jgi:MoaA/NifB/PqqE/SkfB family radical SAM enzyme
MSLLLNAKNKQQLKNLKEDATNQGLILSLNLLKKSLPYGPARNLAISQIEKKFHDSLLSNPNYLLEVQRRKSDFIKAMFQGLKRNMDRGYISSYAGQRLLEILAINNIKNEKIRIKFEKDKGIKPPWFITLSPTQRCNLRCTGCYASAKVNAPTLPFDIVDKLSKEVSEVWGSTFMTISGGEPLMYRDSNKTLFDLWEKYNNMLFMFYTNGTLITKEVAQRMAKLGNVVPAISIEGLEKHTDLRRGKGVHARVLESMKHLREAGVPFAVSVTATSKNIRLLLKDKFYDDIFKKQGASLMWVFQLMPIGQAKDMKELMVLAKQRVQLERKQKQLVRKKEYTIADFWNSGMLSEGCIAYGARGGYLYVDWNGKIMPCVFVPFYEDTIFDLYAKNKTLTDALFSNLFKRGRKWQDDYSLAHTKTPCNLLMPCSIRDHWANFKENILTKNSKPEDEFAAQALKSKEYSKELEKFDDELKELTEPLWKKEFLNEK